MSRMVPNIGSLGPGIGGGKAQGLDLLVKNGIPVPAAFILSERDTLPPLTGKLYAVRSSGKLEDGAAQSFAGQFLSKTRVARVGVPRAIEDLKAHAQEIGATDGFTIIIQDWVEARVAGVAFSRHPTKDMPVVMVIDAVQGSNEQLMSGEMNAQRAFVWSDATLTPGDFPLPDQVLKELRGHMQHIEKLLEHPADVEWAWDGHRLWILQARPITRIPDADVLDREEARVMHLFATQPEMILDRNDFAESAPRPNEKTFKMIQGLYKAQGSFHKASEELGLNYSVEDGENYIHLVFGWLYADTSKHPTRTPKGLFSGLKSVLRLSSELTRFAHDFYSEKLSDEDPNKTYAKASILAKFAQTQKNRPVSNELWALREQSSKKRNTWSAPKNMSELYAIIREDSKVATYSASSGDTVSIPVVITRREALDIRNAASEASGELRGEGVSPGTVSGEAFISSQPKSMDSDVILIVPALTPNWFPFLNGRVKGLISETGSSMSHGAIQCRERGIPAIFGMRGAMTRISNGEKISLDGKSGEVKKK